MKTFTGIWLAAAALFALQGCSNPRPAATSPAPASTSAAMDPEFQAILKPVQQRFAPDLRMALFNVTAQRDGAQVVLTGEVLDPEARREAVAAFQSRNFPVQDRITVLPSEKLGERTWGIVRVSVANVREQQGQGAELGTQVLMGRAVRLLKLQGGWYYVLANDPYLGWMEDDMVQACTRAELEAWNAAKKLFVTAFAERIWSAPSNDSEPVADVTAGGLVQHLGTSGGWHHVALADGRKGYLSAGAAMPLEEWQRTRHATGDNIEKTARSFMGLPYLWGGTSMKGVDCSGFTRMVFLLNGIELHRNASQQARQGLEVPLDSQFSRLQKGDLLFFGSRGGGGRPERVTHVGIYLGNKQFIHSSGMVKINSLDPRSPLLDECRLRGLLKARRMLPGEAHASGQ